MSRHAARMDGPTTHGDEAMNVANLRFTDLPIYTVHHHVRPSYPDVLPRVV